MGPDCLRIIDLDRQPPTQPTHGKGGHTHYLKRRIVAGIILSRIAIE